MAAQDDEREREMRTLFNLTKPDKYGRGDIDAVLELRSRAIPEDLQGIEVLFELKSTTKGKPDISTVRDFGLHHIEKWRDLHWIFGVYGRDGRGEQSLQYCLYASPEQMQPWFDEKSAYIAADVALADHVPDLITPEILDLILSGSDTFDREDAKRLMKAQYSAEAYTAAADLDGTRYSRDAMLRMLRERCRYVIRRGSTLNNPHIPAGYFNGWERITEDHAARLRELVVDALQAQEGALKGVRQTT